MSNVWIRHLLAVIVGYGSILSVQGEWTAGPLAHSFETTFGQGLREEFFGPLLYQETRENESTWGIPFLFTRRQDSLVDSDEWDFVYPFLGYDRIGEESRLQLLQFIQLHGGKTTPEEDAQRLAIFPFYFHQRSSDPEKEYTAFLPFYGHMKNRFLRDEIDFVLWPLYVKTRKRDVVTWNYLAPIFHWRRGDGLRGWQCWPLVSWDRKEPTTRTLMTGDEEVVGGHRRLTLIWPLFFRQHNGIGTERPSRQGAFVPFYRYERSAMRQSITAPWPIGFTATHDRVRQYREYGFPWPFLVWANGEGKTTRRVWPLFGLSHNATQRSDFYAWPLYRYREKKNKVTVKGRHQVLFYLYSHTKERDVASDEMVYERWDLWPLYTAYRNKEGDRRVQWPALLEPILPGNESVERNYSHAWSIWRSETEGATGKSSQSLLWNLYRRESSPKTRKVSFLFGLFQFERNDGHRRWKIAFIPFGSKKARP